MNLDPNGVRAIRQRQDLELDELNGRNGDSRLIQTQDRESGMFVPFNLEDVVRLSSSSRNHNDVQLDNVFFFPTAKRGLV